MDDPEVHVAENNDKEQRYSVDKKVPEIRPMSSSIEKKGSKSRFSFGTNHKKESIKVNDHAAIEAYNKAKIERAKSSMRERFNLQMISWSEMRDIALTVIVPIMVVTVAFYPPLCDPFQNDDTCELELEEGCCDKDKAANFRLIPVIIFCTFLHIINFMFCENFVMWKYFGKGYDWQEHAIDLACCCVTGVAVHELAWRLWDYTPPFLLLMVMAMVVPVTKFVMYLIIYKNYYPEVPDAEKSDFIRSCIWDFILYMCSYATFLINISFTMGYKLLKECSDAGTCHNGWFVFYSVFGLNLMFVANMDWFLWMYQQSDMSSFQIGQNWVILCHYMCLNVLRGSSTENLVQIIILSVGDIIGIVKKMVLVYRQETTMEFIKNMFSKIRGQKIDKGRRDSTMTMMKTLFSMCLNEMVEFTTTITYTAVMGVLYFSPNYSLIAGFGASRFMSPKVEQEAMPQFFKTLGWLILVEFLTVAMVVGVMKLVCGVNCLTTILHHFRENSLVVGNFGCIAFLAYNLIMYLPFGIDFSVEFDWLH